MKNLLSIAAIGFLFMLMNCAGNQPQAQDNNQWISKVRAKQIAVNFLIERNKDDEYIVGTGQVSEKNNENWLVTFRRTDASSGGGNGTVTVRKSDGKVTVSDL